MSGLDGLLAYSLGALTGAYIFSVLFRYALLGTRGTKLQQFWVITLMGVSAIGVGAVGAGEGSFGDRIGHPPDFGLLVIQPLAALVVGLIVLLQRDDVEDIAERQRAKGAVERALGVAGRSIALIVVVPLIVIGTLNNSINLYNLISG